MDKLNLNSIDGAEERDNFRKLDQEFQTAPILRGQWKVFDLQYSTSGTHELIHGLGFKPTDLIETFKTANVTYNFGSFTADKITITTTGAARIRILLGRM